MSSQSPTNGAGARHPLWSPNPVPGSPSPRGRRTGRCVVLVGAHPDGALQRSSGSVPRVLGEEPEEHGSERGRQERQCSRFGEAVADVRHCAEGHQSADRAEHACHRPPSRSRGAHRGREELGQQRAHAGREHASAEHSEEIAHDERRTSSGVGDRPTQRRGHQGDRARRPASHAVGQPASEQQPGEAGDARPDHHQGRPTTGLVQDVLGVEEHEAVGRPGDDREGERDEGQHEDTATVRRLDRAKHGRRMLGRCLLQS